MVLELLEHVLEEHMRASDLVEEHMLVYDREEPPEEHKMVFELLHIVWIVLVLQQSAS